MSQLISYEYNDQIIEFDVTPDSLMVNATEMSKIFGKKVGDFTRLDQTKTFIDAFIKNANQRFISEGNSENSQDLNEIKSENYSFISDENKEKSPFISGRKTKNSEFLEEDLIRSSQKSGTWMHRILALKFAAWLSPEFEVWVYHTIDDLIFGEYKRLKTELTASAQRKRRIEELEAELSENEDFTELEQLKTEERRSAYRRGKVIKNQLQLFKKQI